MELRRHGAFVAWVGLIGLGCGDDGTAGSESDAGSSTGAATASTASTTATTSEGSTGASATSSATTATSGTDTVGPMCEGATPWATGAESLWVASLNPEGTTINDGVQTAVSTDGQFVAFAAVRGSETVPSGEYGVLVVDNACGELLEAGTSGPFGPRELDLSADGGTVVFVKTTDEPLLQEVIAYDLETGATERIDVDPDGNPVQAGASRISVSGDGRYIAFSSNSDALSPDDPDAIFDVFVRDRSLQTTEVVSVRSDGEKANNESDGPVISADGQIIAFYSRAPNLSVPPGSVGAHVYVHDRSTGMTELVSGMADETNANIGTGIYPSMSGDGRFVTFEIETSLLAEDTDVDFDVYLYDRMTQTLELVSIDSGAHPHAFGGRVSDDGRFVAFETGPNWLASEIVYLRDRQEGTTTRVSQPIGSPDENGRSYQIEISADSNWLVFGSESKNLVDPPLALDSRRNVFMAAR